MASTCAEAFPAELKAYKPFSVLALQTDNGAEFLGHFARSAEEELITHYFSHPCYPKGNAFMERVRHRPPNMSSGPSRKLIRSGISTSWLTSGTTPTTA